MGSEGPVPMDHLSLQCDGNTESPGSSLMGKDVNLLLSTSADFISVVECQRDVIRTMPF